MSATTKRPTIFFDERPSAPVAKSVSKSQPAPTTTSKSSTRGKNGARGKSTKRDNGDKQETTSDAEIKRQPVTSNKARKLLLEQWKEKQARLLNGEEGLGDEVEDLAASGSSIKDILKEGEDIDTVKKESVFKAELTEVEQDIIKKRVAQQQRQYEEFRKREINKKYAKIRLVHRHVTEQEVAFALKECNDDESEVIERLTKPGFLQLMRKKIAFDLEGREFTEKDEEEDEEGEGGQTSNEVPKKNLHPRKQRKRKSSDEDESGEKDKVVKKRRRRQKKEDGEEGDGEEKGAKPAKGRRRIAKLKLDDALAVKEQNGQFAGWSEARIRAFKLIKHNPNAYYYRFNAPGEAQRNGPWSKEEKELFFKRVAEIGVNRQWGIFSMTIPGRVGYQCSNFYRHLIEKGKVKDENYEIDANGKAHFKFKKGPRKSWAKKDSNDGGEKKQPIKKRKRASHDDEEDDEGGDEDTEYRPPTSRRKPTEEVEQEEQEGGEEKDKEKKDNPLPGFIDPITLDEVEQPAISPYGHVMSYSSWSRCLTGNNICPLTKKPLKKRDLVVLTWDNIDQYIENIVNWN